METRLAASMQGSPIDLCLAFIQPLFVLIPACTMRHIILPLVHLCAICLMLFVKSAVEYSLIATVAAGLCAQRSHSGEADAPPVASICDVGHDSDVGLARIGIHLQPIQRMSRLCLFY